MIDERGRGGVIDPDDEYICGQMLLRAIWEKAIEDAAYLDTLGVAQHTIHNSTLFRSEVEAFAKSKWAHWIFTLLNDTSVDIIGSKERSIHSAERYKMRKAGAIFAERKLPYNGQEHTVAEWGEIYKVQPATIASRWNDRKGWKNPKWLDGLDKYKMVSKVRYEYKGEMLTAWMIAKIAKLTPSEVQRGLRNGMTAEEAVEAARKLRIEKGLPVETIQK